MFIKVITAYIAEEGEMFPNGKKWSSEDRRTLRQRNRSRISASNIHPHLTGCRKYFMGHEIIKNEWSSEGNEYRANKLCAAGCRLWRHSGNGELYVAQQQMVKLQKQCLPMQKSLFWIWAYCRTGTRSESEKLYTLVDKFRSQREFPLFLFLIVLRICTVWSGVTVLRFPVAIELMINGITNADLIKAMVGRDHGSFPKPEVQPGEEDPEVVESFRTGYFKISLR